MSELDEAKAMLAERRQQDAERRAAQAHQNRVQFKREFMAGRVQLLCECDYCIGEVLALRTPDRWECARLKEISRNVPATLTTVEIPLED